MLIDKYPLYFLNKYNNAYEFLYVVYDDRYAYINNMGEITSDGLQRFEGVKILKEWIRTLFIQLDENSLQEAIKTYYTKPEIVLKNIELIKEQHEYI